MSGPRNPIPYNKMRPQGCIFYTGLDKIRRSIFNDGMRRAFMSFYVFFAQTRSRTTITSVLQVKRRVMNNQNQVPFAALGRSFDIFDSGRELLAPDFGLQTHFLY